MKRSLLLLAIAVSVPSAARADDWGNYAIVPVSAPKMVLEAVDAGKADGTVVSINKPAGKDHQKWSIVAKEAGWFAIQPAHDSSLALAVAQGAAKQGSTIVLEKNSGKASQL